MTIIKEITKHFADYPVFTYRDVALFLNGKAKVVHNLPRLMSYMKSNGMLYSVEKGVYTFNNDIMIAGFAYSPFYYGLLSALTIRDLWTQNSRPEIMTPRKVRKSMVHAFGKEKDIVFVHHVPVKYFFGFDIVDYGKLKVPVSDPEKTLIDLFYYKVKLAIQDYSAVLKAIDMKKLERYLKEYDGHTISIVSKFVDKYKPVADSGKLESPY